MVLVVGVGTDMGMFRFGCSLCDYLCDCLRGQLEIASTMTETEKKIEIQKLQNQKVELLDKYGVFGGHQFLNEAFREINKQLEALDVDPNS